MQVLSNKGGLLRGRLPGLSGGGAGQQRAQGGPRRLVLLKRLRLSAQREGDVVIRQPPAVALVHLTKGEDMLVMTVVVRVCGISSGEGREGGGYVITRSGGPCARGVGRWRRGGTMSDRGWRGWTM